MGGAQRGVARVVVVQLVVGVLLAAAAVALGWWIVSRGSEPPQVDQWWNALVAQWWHPALTGFALVMNWIGGGWVGVLAVPIGGAVALVLLRRRWAAVYFLAAEAVSAGMVQLLKNTFDRVRPEDMQVISDHGSYPSGHVANAATIAVAAFVIFPRLWVAVAGAAWVVLMAFSRTYLHAHWLTDTVGGALIGAAAALLLAAAFAVPLTREGMDASPRAAG